MRSAVERAAPEDIAAAGSPLLLICFHFDPTTGRYSLEVLKVLRLAGILTVLTIAGMLFLLYRREAGAVMKLWLAGGLGECRGSGSPDLGAAAISLAVLALVFGLMFRYIVKYRAGSPFDRGAVAQKTWRIETAWTAGTLLVFFGLFIWGADLYVRIFQPPRDALKIYVIAKQWMWKVEHVGGQREINALHIPAGRPIELVMTSEDVIHDFSVPAFRLKHDVLPDRYETLWFTATRPGTYSLVLHPILRPRSFQDDG